MANRVATSMKTSNHQNYLRQLELKKKKLSSKVSGQEKNISLADNPAASGLASKYRSDLSRIDGYVENIQRISGENELVHNQIQKVSEVMARVKELTVQASNGTYSESDLKACGIELNQMLEYMIDIGNLTDENGNALFAGTKKLTKAFEGYMGRVPGGTEPMVVQVDYMGNTDQTEVAIDQGKIVSVDRSGSRIFWGEPESIWSSVNGSDYRVLEDSSISINNKNINLRAGDNIHSIVARINASTVAVTSRVDPNGALVIEGNKAEQLILRDGPNSTVLQDLGILNGGETPPFNISSYAQKSGGNIFNQLINVRDMMFKGDVDALGTRGLRAVENAHSSVVNNLAAVGAQNARMAAMSNALETRRLDVTGANVDESVVTDMDRTDLLLKYKELDQVHTATLQSAAKALTPSLLDFLR